MRMTSTQTLLKPRRLKAGDTVAVLSPSSGLPHRFPRVFDLGLTNLRDELGVRILEYPTTRADGEYLARSPKARADDINAAFADPGVSAVIASIGGDDSVRILPYLDRDVISANPKILMGYSDFTTLTTYLNQLGLVTFNGPSIMAGFAQARHLSKAFMDHVKSILMNPADRYDYAPFDAYSNGYVDWTDSYDGETKPSVPNANGWQWLQGDEVRRGRLFGGCFEVMEFLKGTDYWPAPDFWDGKILFLETSEEKPGVPHVKRMLRNYGMQGVFGRISGLLMGRARDYTDEEKDGLNRAILAVVAGEFAQTSLPVVANMDFGHTDPQWIMPLGIEAEIDCVRQTFSLQEAAVQ